MSLYQDAVSVLTSPERQGSLKSRIYGKHINLRSNPASVYALITETSKFNPFLKEVIDKSEILSYELKVLARPQVFELSLLFELTGALINL